MTDDQAERVGKRVIELFGLRVDRFGRVDTSWGTKTAKGLGRSIQQVVQTELGDEYTWVHIPTLAEHLRS